MNAMKDAPRDGTRILAYRSDEDWKEWIIVSWSETGSEPFGDGPEWTTDIEGPGYSTGFSDEELAGWQPLPQKCSP